MLKGLKKWVLISLGSFSLVLGVIGLFVPILPTTPFLLLASFCFMHSSKSLYHKLIEHRIFGTYIQNYMIHRSASKRAKWVAMMMLWISLSISIYMISNALMRILLAGIGLFVSIHVLSLKTLKLDEEKICTLNKRDEISKYIDMCRD